VELLLTEEVGILVASLVACGFLVLGVLELLWPSEGAERREARAGIASPRPREVPPTPTAPPPIAGGSAPPAAAAPAEPTALAVGRTLLERARAEPPDALARRVTYLQTAVRWLERAGEGLPGDAAAGEALGRARAALWAAYQEVALQRLAAEMPWGTTALARPRALSATLPPAPEPAAVTVAADPALEAS
jgi:hypothetical protein